MREYETTFIVQPEISDEGSASILERLGGILEQHGDIKLYCEDLGKRRLAYEINKFHKGHYYLLTYLGEGKAVSDLERSLRLDESVLRFMTIQAVEHVEDIEARKAEALEFEKEQEKRVAERAAREAEEARARAEAEVMRARESDEAASAMGEDEELAFDPDEQGDSDLGESEDLGELDSEEPDEDEEQGGQS
jgi:small subunit ribosomal protein S6